tara:strand:+ start:7025 stop:7690 length:666 start_codon:yes stop_codon:yes gene_type:complete
MVKVNLYGTLPTATGVVSLATAKSFLRITHSAEDTLITNLITASVEVAQNYTNSKFLKHEYDLTMETWDDVYVSNFYRQDLTDGSFITRGGYVGKDGLNQIVLPYPPLISLDHIKYYDASNTLITWDSSNYRLLTYLNQKGSIEIKDGVTLPTLKDRGDAVQIRFKCGYTNSDTDGSDIPEAIKTAILLILGRMYELREDSVSRLPKASEYLLDPYRFKTF